MHFPKPPELPPGSALVPVHPQTPGEVAPPGPERPPIPPKAITPVHPTARHNSQQGDMGGFVPPAHVGAEAVPALDAPNPAPPESHAAPEASATPSLPHANTPAGPTLEQASDTSAPEGDIAVVTHAGHTVVVNQAHPDNLLAQDMLEEIRENHPPSTWTPVTPEASDPTRNYYQDSPVDPTFFAKTVSEHHGTGTDELIMAPQVRQAVNSDAAQQIAQAADLAGGIHFVEPLCAVVEDTGTRTMVYPSVNALLDPGEHIVTDPPSAEEASRLQQVAENLKAVLQNNNIDPGDLHPGQFVVSAAGDARKLHIVDIEDYRPLVADPPSAPEFLPARDVQAQLDLLPGNFSRMRPELFALVLGEKTYRVPASYVDAYQQWLDGRQANMPTIRQFAATGLARAAIHAAEAGLQAELNRLQTQQGTEPAIAALDLAGLVNVNEQTIDAWRRAGLPVQSIAGRYAYRKIAASALNSFMRWRYPASYPTIWKQPG